MTDILSLIQGIATIVVVTGVLVVIVRLLDGPDLRDLDGPRRAETIAVDEAWRQNEPHMAGAAEGHHAERPAAGRQAPDPGDALPIWAIVLRRLHE